MPEPKICYLVECNMMPESGPPGMVPTIKHPVAIFDNMADAEAWVRKCLHCGRLAHKLQREEPDVFNEMLAAGVAEDDIARRARKQEDDPRKLLWELKLQHAAKLNPYDPQSILSLQATKQLGRLSVLYNIHELPFNPEAPGEDAWAEIYPDEEEIEIPEPASE